MSGLLVPRLAVKKVRRAGVVSLEPGGLEAFSGGGSLKAERFEVEFLGLAAQSLEGGEIILVRPGSEIVAAGFADPGYCRWHNAPLDRPDDPLERRYCPKKARGFCSEHAGSLRAFYDACLAGYSLEACRRVDDELGGGVEYTVYLASSGWGKVKVGVTRSFRLLERLAEQHHLVATEAYRTRSLLEARRAEIALSKLPGITDKSRRGVKGGRSEAAYSLEEAAARAEKLLGARRSRRLFFVDAPQPPALKAELRRGEKLVLEGFSYGRLWLSGRSATTSSLLHRMLFRLL